MRLHTHAQITAVLPPGSNGILIAPDGQRYRVRVEEDGAIFVYARGLRRWGRRLRHDRHLPPEWRTQGVIVRPRPTEAQELATRLRRAAQAILRYTPCDVWPELAADAHTVLASAAQLARAADDGYGALLETFRSLRLHLLPLDPRITTLRTQGAKDHHIQEALDAFRRREPFTVCWEGKYLCVASGGPSDDGCYRGHLATEYRDRGNGHYWALLDGIHAVYLESD